MPTGLPFSVYHSGQDPNADGYLTDRAVFLGDDLSHVYRTTNPADGYFDITQFEGMNTRVARLGAAAACGRATA